MRPFNDTYKPITNVRTVNAAFAVDLPDGTTYILHVNQALDFTDSMEHSILCTNQARYHGLVIDDVPPIVDVTNSSTHSVYFPPQDVRLPLRMHGPVSHIHVRYPSDWDMDNCEHLHLTDADSLWDPSLFDEPALINAVRLYQDPIVYHMMQEDLLERIVHSVQVSSITNVTRRDILTPEYLSDLWGIGLEQACRTIQSTTNHSIRLLEGMPSRRVKTKAYQRMYNQLGGYLAKFASDTFKSKVKSTRGNSCIQLFTNNANYTKCYSLASRSEAPQALDRFLNEVGIPMEMMTDGAPELVHGEWTKICKCRYIHQRATEPESPWQNPAELAGGIIKRRVRNLMKTTGTPVRLWDYCWSYASDIRCVTATRHIYLDDVTPFEKVHGYTPNIAEFLSFKWFDWR